MARADKEKIREQKRKKNLAFHCLSFAKAPKRTAFGG